MVRSSRSPRPARSQTLVIFDGTDGDGPAGGLVQGTDGNFYGATISGGANNSCEFGCGTLFEITPSGTLTTLYNFCSQGGEHCRDGDLPYNAVIQGTDGSFYGTAWSGGADDDGTVFSLSVGLGPFVKTNPASGKVGTAVKILYQLISGMLPFGRGLGAVPTIVAAKLPRQPTLFRTKLQFQPLTDHLWSIVEACLQKDALKRPIADQLVEMCSKLCYSNAERRVGSINSFRGRGRGNWGFIDIDGGETAFFHQDNFYGDTITVGGRVNFADFSGVPRDRAFPVLPMK